MHEAEEKILKEKQYKTQKEIEACEELDITSKIVDDKFDAKCMNMENI